MSKRQFMIGCVRNSMNSRKKLRYKILAEVAHIVNQRTVQAAAAGIQLPHAARHEVDKDVRVADFFIGFFAEFSVHVFSVQIKLHSLSVARPKATTKIPFVAGRAKQEKSCS